jgi:hypothetical protein
MLNKRGGYIFLGIDEKPSFKVTGFNWSIREGLVQEKIENKLRQNFQSYPARKIDIHVVKQIPPSVIREKNKMLVAIHVRRKGQSESFFRATGKEGKTEHKHAVWSRSGSQVCLEQK